MRLEYSLTLADYIEAFKLHRQQRLSRRFVPWIGPCLLLIALIGLVVFSLNNNIGLAAQSIALGAGATVLTIGIPISRFINTRKSYNRLFQKGNMDRYSYIEINEQQIVRTLSGTSELKVLWSGVYDFVQNEKITMIYTNKDCFLLVPTQKMSPEQRAELSNIVARQVIRN